MKNSEKSTNNITRKTFEFLADSGIMYIDNIKKFYKTLNKSGKAPMDAVTLFGIKTSCLNTY